MVVCFDLLMQFPAFQAIAYDSSFQHNSVEFENWIATLCLWHTLAFSEHLAQSLCVLLLWIKHWSLHSVFICCDLLQNSCVEINHLVIFLIILRGKTETDQITSCLLFITLMLVGTAWSLWRAKSKIFPTKLGCLSVDIW